MNWMSRIVTGVLMVGAVGASKASAQYPYPYPSGEPRPYSEVTELGQCVILGAFDPADIQREERPGISNPDRIFFDLSTMDVKQLRLVVYDGWGKQVFTETLFRCAPQLKHFEIFETEGNEFYLTKQIRYYLKQQELYRCPAQVKCFAGR